MVGIVIALMSKNINLTELRKQQLTAARLSSHVLYTHACTHTRTRTHAHTHYVIRLNQIIETKKFTKQTHARTRRQDIMADFNIIGIMAEMDTVGGYA